MSDEQPEPELTDDEVFEQKAVRLAKRERLIESGVGAYPVGVPLTDTIGAVRARFDNLAADEKTGEIAALAGRVVSVRNAGKLCFVQLQAGDGDRLQAMLSQGEVGEESLALFKELVDLGDHLFVRGEIISSRTGELSIFVTDWQITSKAILPLPNLHNELSEESRVRSRYLDLIVRERARYVVRARATTNASLRATFASHGYLEVETPMLQTLHGGAAARPFATHSNAFDTELYLRIAPELFLKRAVVGGIDRVFEINRNFRNEGADSTHSPEFAMLEAYQAYGDYLQMADLTQEMIQNAAQAVAGSTTVTWADGSEYDFGGEWDRIDMYESLAEASGCRRDRALDRRGARGARRGPSGSRWRCPATASSSRSCGSTSSSVAAPADVRHGLSGRYLAARSAAPLEARGRREVGPLRARLRARDRLLRVGRPGDPGASASSNRRCWRARAIPRPCAWTRSSCAPSNTACRDGWHGHGHRSAAHGHHGPRHSRDHPLSVGEVECPSERTNRGADAQGAEPGRAGAADGAGGSPFHQGAAARAAARTSPPKGGLEPQPLPDLDRRRRLRPLPHRHRPGRNPDEGAMNRRWSRIAMAVALVGIIAVIAVVTLTGHR